MKWVVLVSTVAVLPAALFPSVARFWQKFRPVQQKSSAAEEKIRPPGYFFSFYKQSYRGLMKKIIFFTYLDSEKKRKKTNFRELWRLLSLFDSCCTNRAQFGHTFVRPFHFLFGPVWVMRPKSRHVGNTSVLLFCNWCESTAVRLLFLSSFYVNISLSIVNNT